MLKLASAKLTFMSDLYEIKSNIDLRLRELEDYREGLATEHKWKGIVGDLLTPDYESSILFVLSKAEEIQDDSLNYAHKFLADYNNKIFLEVHEPFKKEMKLAIESLFCNFLANNEKKRKLGDNPRISDLNYR
jgi:hypothetical protein